MTIDELREELTNRLLKNNIKRSTQVMFVLPKKDEDGNEEYYSTYDININLKYHMDKQKTPYVEITLL